MPEVLVNGARIVFEERGKGFPTILLHGWNSSRREWLFNMKALAPRFRAIAPDLPGFGDSEDLDGFSYALPDTASFLEAFRRRLRLQSFNLVGHSMGGCIAVRYTAEYPDTVRKLVLISTPTRSSSMALRVRIPGVSWFLSKTYRFRSEAVLKWLFYHNLYKPEYQDLDFVRANIQTMSCTTKKALVQSAVLFRRLDLKDDLHGISQPTLIIFGDKDRAVSTKEVYLQKENLARPYLGVITGSGHSPNYERPDIFNQLLVDFFLEETLG
ncbi:MAG: hypothetical protein A2V52_01355 [Actinobacteria bacterium RBG_19FT_COMBO_54_7]|uniref:AB hydrolase-1 domain-containing protein n=1 Tax=Candidatus Solincola sediminis TaxID=1797199 RepID=A0A1F2WRL8_9ACTN|nr:MAG: hypothetical protein A2Y75_11495 [Candidatus Solincola sediminis]OFW70259.1 MAG: hypothetical protein A2V52_01355 [Actinobacteria bacterium RBG_19FT_COMBO_54_7]